MPALDLILPIPDSGRTDPLYWAAVRFAAARREVGPVGLMRRFKIGRGRATNLVLTMRDERLTYRRGHRGVYRLMPLIWGWLEVVGSHPDAPSDPAGYRLYLNGHPAYRNVPGWAAQGGA
jgi:hypothetical protein